VLDLKKLEEAPLIIINEGATNEKCIFFNPYNNMPFYHNIACPDWLQGAETACTQ
jgi:hypothetical protein